MQTDITPILETKMADFRPFRAWRYNESKVSIQDVIAPPYDVISPQGQDTLYERSVYNVIRLILNRIEPTDTTQNSRYTRARDFFNQWKKDQVIIQENEPCYYFYQQTFSVEGGSPQTRSALLGRMKLEPFEKGIVVPHEKTLSKPKKDRRMLLEATKTNFSPIFGLYVDEQKKIHQIMAEVAKSKPLFEAKDDEGVQHVLWPIQEPNRIATIQSVISNEKVYIADGHHRYQTALDYSQDQKKANQGAPKDEPLSDFVLTALVEFQDPGLELFPTHRILTLPQGFDRKKAIDSLKTCFKVERFPKVEWSSRLKTKKNTAAANAKTSFGILFGQDEAYWLTLENPELVKKQMIAGKPEFWYELDVNLITHLILAKLWAVPESEWESLIRYTHSNETAIKASEETPSPAVFLLKAPEVDILRKMGAAKELMPQKSTYFYPKLASGLVFYGH